MPKLYCEKAWLILQASLGTIRQVPGCEGNQIEQHAEAMLRESLAVLQASSGTISEVPGCEGNRIQQDAEAMLRESSADSSSQLRYYKRNARSSCEGNQIQQHAEAMLRESLTDFKPAQAL